MTAGRVRCSAWLAVAVTSDSALEVTVVLVLASLALALLVWVWTEREDFWRMLPVRLALTLVGLSLAMVIGSAWMRANTNAADPEQTTERQKALTPTTPPLQTTPPSGSFDDAAARLHPSEQLNAADAPK